MTACMSTAAPEFSAFHASRPALARPERERERERRRARRGGGASGPAGRLEDVQKVLAAGPVKPSRTSSAGPVARVSKADALKTR
jgi:hypothetical protein